jgi:hypothetical protein
MNVLAECNFSFFVILRLSFGRAETHQIYPQILVICRDHFAAKAQRSSGIMCNAFYSQALLLVERSPRLPQSAALT